METKQDLNILLETKNEYTQELVSALTPALMKHFSSVYNNILARNKIHRLILKEFQQGLAGTAEWTDDDKRIVYKEIKSKVDWIDNLVNSFFVTKSKILASVNHQDHPLSMTMETAQEFVYKCHLNTARELWKRPDLFYNRVSNIQQQKNLEQLRNLIHHSIKQTIRSSLPLREILKLNARRSEVQEIEVTDKETHVKYQQDEEIQEEPETFDEEDDEYASDEEDSDDDEETEEEDAYDEESEVDEDEEHEDNDDINIVLPPQESPNIDHLYDVEEPFDITDDNVIEGTDDTDDPIIAQEVGEIIEDIVTKTIEEEQTTPEKLDETPIEPPEPVHGNDKEVNINDFGIDTEIKSVEIVGNEHLLNDFVGDVVDDDILKSDVDVDESKEGTVKVLEIENEFF